MADVSKLNINNIDYDIKDTKSRFPQWTSDPVAGLPVSEEYIGTSVKKITQYLNNLGNLAFKNSLTSEEIITSLGYIPTRQSDFEEAIATLQENFQAGVDAVYNAVAAKGSTPASHSLSDVVDAIGRISTGGLYMTKEIREDGTYYPSDDGVDAYSLVIVSKDVGEPHTVVFYDVDRTTILKTQVDVPYHGYASCTVLDGTTLAGKNFKGWNPSPNNIVRDTMCFPMYGDYKIESGEIEDDWETICAKKGADYPIGSYKSLILNIRESSDINNPFVTAKYYRSESNWTVFQEAPITTAANNQIIFQYPSFMVKVAEGEDGSNSTWLSANCATIPDGVFLWRDTFIDKTFEMTAAAFLSYTGNPLGNWNNAHCDDWETSTIRRMLNGKIFNSLDPCLKDNIKEVNKYSMGLTEQTPYGTRVQKSTIDKIWIPSLRELNTIMSVARIGGAILPANYSELAEIDGIDYTINYTPVWPDGVTSGTWWLRTEGQVNASVPNTQVGVGWNDWGLGPELWINNYSNVSFGRFPFGFCL